MIDHLMKEKSIIIDHSRGKIKSGSGANRSFCDGLRKVGMQMPQCKISANKSAILRTSEKRAEEHQKLEEEKSDEI